MKKKIILISMAFMLNIIFSISLFAQHTVNDITQHGGWYKARIEMFQSENVTYHITQCYPSGDEYEVIGTEREKLPLYLKVLCMFMVEEGIKDSVDFNEMTFEQDGYFMQLASFSFTFIFNFSKTEAEILNEIGDERIKKYRYRKWS
jgi:hypothetical protein